MYTLTLDEYGDFEGVKEERDAVFIGGIIYNDNDVQYELNTEKKRIRAYYKAAIAEASKQIGYELKYPDALHFTKYNNEEEKKKMGREIAASKNVIGKTLQEFLLKGTFNGEKLMQGQKAFEDRKGEYQIYAIMKSENGKTGRISESAECILNDEYASNLYFHMASDVLGRAVFQNPLIGNDSVFGLQIATRSSGNIPRDSELSIEYKELGYTGTKKKRQKDGSMVDIMCKDGDRFVPAVYYELTNMDIYRSAVAQYVADRNPRNIKIQKLDVESINYNQANSKDCAQEMLYMADSICSFLSFNLNKKGENEVEWFNELYKRAKRLLPEKQLLVFAYDDADIDFSRALDAYQSRDYYKTLEILYDSRSENSPLNKFYDEKWFHYLRKEIIFSKDTFAIKRAVSQLYDSQLSNSYDQDKGLFILNVLETAALNNEKTYKMYESYDSLIKLYEAGMIAYCHKGDSQNAENYFKRLEKYVNIIPFEEYIRMRNTLCVCFTDNFEWEKALKLAKENVELQKQISAVKKSVANKKTKLKFLGEAKALSQLGQVYSFCRDDHAIECFNEAMEIFGEASANYYISLSYLLHYYIATNRKEEFEALATKYFGGYEKDVDRLEYIFRQAFESEPVLNLKFAIYVFVKYLYVFNIPISKEAWNILANIDGYVNCNFEDKLNKKWHLRQHPSELIYKYITLISIKRSNQKVRLLTEGLIDKSMEDSSPIIYAIKTIAKIDILEISGDIKGRDALIKELKKFLIESFDALSGLSKIRKTDDVLKAVKTYFTYMYE